MSDISKYLDSIESRIDDINTCEVLQGVSDDIQAELQELLDQLNSDLAELLEEQTASSDPMAYLALQIQKAIRALNTTITETALLTTRIGNITAKLASKISTLGCDFPPPEIG